MGSNPTLAARGISDPQLVGRICISWSKRLATSIRQGPETAAGQHSLGSGADLYGADTAVSGAAVR